MNVSEGKTLINFTLENAHLEEGLKALHLGSRPSFAEGKLWGLLRTVGVPATVQT